MPIPLLSPSRLKRAILLHTIRNRSMLVANAGSERTRGTDPPLMATPAPDGICIDGTCEYMSLGSVADIVFFKANVAGDDRMVMCAADLRGDSIRIGEWKFGGRMRLADTASITFEGHSVPKGRYVFTKNAGMQGVADYQRCWFHLFVAELYLARIRHLHAAWRLPGATEHEVTL